MGQLLFAELWYMMKRRRSLRAGEEILGHSNTKMTERYAKLAREHITTTRSAAREMWKLDEPNCDGEEADCGRVAKL